MSERFKLCPSCSFENDEFDPYCKGCGVDIMTIEAFTREQLERSRATAVNAKNAKSSASQSKECPKCKKPNPVYAVVCVHCSERLPGHSLEQKKSDNLSLASGTTPPRAYLLIGKNRIELHHGDVLGREGTVEVGFFSLIPEVSRKHASLELVNSDWMITALSPNKTVIDGQRIKTREKGKLTSRHEIELSSKCKVVIEIA